MTRIETAFTRHVGIDVPLICGAMYPCSNPELVAAVSAAGGIGVLQPISLTYVHGHDFRDGIRYMRSLTSGPIGRSEEHTSELQSQSNLVCRLLLEKKNKIKYTQNIT